MLTQMLRNVKFFTSRATSALFQKMAYARFMINLRRLRSMPSIKKSKRPRILILSPEAGIVPHYSSCCMIAKILDDLGFETFMARCFDQFRYCTVKRSKRLPIQSEPTAHQKTCCDCAAISLANEKAYNLRICELRGLETKILLKTASAASSAVHHDLMSFKFKGVPLGAMCSYEVRLVYKALTLDAFGSDLQNLWSNLVTTAIKMYLLVESALTRFRFNHVLYFNDYSISLAARFACEASGAIPVMVTHAYHFGVDRRKWIFKKGIGYHDIYTDCLQWPKWRSLPLNESLVAEITNDALERLKGLSPHTYSPPKTTSFAVKSRREGQKTIVAFTSSPDETACLHALEAMGLKIPEVELTFGTCPEDSQVSWLNALAVFAKTRPDLQFIVRIHPREGSNKREPNQSEHLAILRNTVSHGSDNFLIHWPEDPVSSYDLAEQADLVLTSWSTIGVELARMGVPVLCCAKGLGGYPVEPFQLFTRDPDIYFSMIDELLCKPIDLESMRLAYRWWHFAYLSQAIDVGDVIPRHDYGELPAYKRPVFAQQIAQSVVGNFDQREAVHDNLLQYSNSLTATQEEASALRKAIDKYIMFFMFGATTINPSNVRFVSTSTDISSSEFADITKDLVLFKCGNEITARFGGRKVAKYSPLVSRLVAALIGDNT